MDQLKSYYYDFEVKGKTEDEIFRQLCIDKPYKKLNELNWKEVFIRRFGELMKEIPNPRSTVSRIINEAFAVIGLPKIDTEKTYFNTFGSSMEHFGPTHPEVYHFNSLIESYRVTDACLMNIFIERYRDDWDFLSVYENNGIYSVGHEGAHYPEYAYDPKLNPIWGPKEQVCHANVIANIIYAVSIWDTYKTECIAYWKKYSEKYSDMLADTFLAAGIRQYKNRLLTDQAFLMIRNAYYNKSEEVQVTLLDIYGYPSTDIICLEQVGLPTSRVVLYIPGGAQPFVEFLNVSDLKQWIVWQLKDEKSMNAFRKHFSLKVRQDGTSFTGVDNALKDIAANLSNWPAHKYILYNPVHLRTENLFEEIKDRIKYRILDDGDVQIKSNSEATRDYALSFVETIASQLGFVTMLMYPFDIPINLALSVTSLGLSIDIAVNGDTYAERVYGVGELVGSSIFTAMNLLPVLGEAGNALYNFTKKDIPPFLNTEEYLGSHFNMTREKLDAIRIGNNPIALPGKNSAQIQLVRLSNEDQSLVAIRRWGGNKFIRLNSVTLKDMEGPLISEVINPKTGEIHFLYNSGLLGGSPYNPMHIGLDNVWTPKELELQAAVALRPIGKSYSNILSKLGEIHDSLNLDKRQGLMHELMELIEEYEILKPTSPRLSAFQKLNMQLEDALYLRDTELDNLKQYLLSLPNKGSGAASFLYSRAMNEITGQGERITENLIHFAQNDGIISVPFRGYSGVIPQEITFPVKYVVSDLSVVDSLYTKFYNFPPLASFKAKNNTELLRKLLQELHDINMFEKSRIIDNQLFIGYSNEEMYQSFYGYVRSGHDLSGVYKLTFFKILEEIREGYGFEQSLATRQFFNEKVFGRLSQMENVLLLSDFDYKNWDVLFGKVDYGDLFNAANLDSRIALCMNSYRGVILNNSQKSVAFFLDNLPKFIQNGLEDIVISDLAYELTQADISRFLKGEDGWDVLDSILFNLDENEVNGPYRRLLKAAKDNRLNIIPVGCLDNSIGPFSTPYKEMYYKGGTIMNTIQHLKEGKKFVVITDLQLINSTPGLGKPMPGLSQYLSVPGTIYNEKGIWEFLPELASNRTALDVAELPKWKELVPPNGKILGLKQFKLKNRTFPTKQTRLSTLEKSVPAELREELMSKVEEIKNDPKIRENICYRGGRCDLSAVNVNNRLKDMGLEVGKGASLCWWTKEGAEFSSSNHTAAAFKFNGEDFIVDAAHLQFVHEPIDENVIVLPVEDWAIEIAERTRAINPFLEYKTKAGSWLSMFYPPVFTKPRLARVR